MKKKIYNIFLVRLFCCAAAFPLIINSGNAMQSDDPEISVINQTMIDLGEFTNGAQESISSKKLQYLVEGTSKKKFSWEITDIGDSDISLTVKFFGSSDGNSWTEINRQGSANLSGEGKYYIKIEILQLDVKTEAEEGEAEQFYTVSVEYE